MSFAKITPLDELPFADAACIWNEDAAKARVQKALGWQGLAAYSLLIDPSFDSQSMQAYRFLVADITDTGAKIIPAALEAAKIAADGLDESVKAEVQDIIVWLKERYLENKNKQHSELAPPESSSLEFSSDSSTSLAPSSASRLQATDSSSRNVENLSENLESPIGLEQSVLQAQKVVTELSLAGKLLAAWDKQALVQFVAKLSKEPVISIEGAGVISPYKFFLQIIETLPAMIPAGEFAFPLEKKRLSPESLGHKIAQSIK